MALLYAYNFDEASGNILDSSGNGRATVLGGSLARTASGAGHTDKGMSQTTTAAESNGPSLTGLQTAEFTVMAWVKRTSNSQDGWIGEIKASGSGDRGILLLSGNVQARARNASGSVVNVSTAQLTAGTWYHVAASWSAADSRVHLFINGTEVGTGAALTGPLKTTSTGSHLIDGLGPETVIDDVRYYDAALSAAAIATLMGQPVTGGPTGTGAVTAPAAAVSGSGTVAVSGSGALTVPPSSVIGAGAVTVAGSGQTAGPAAVAAGSGSMLAAGAGEVSAAPSVASGTGEATISGTGQSIAAPASAAGTGVVDVDGGGHLTAPAAAVDGTGTFGSPPAAGDGSLSAPAAIASGIGSVPVAGSGFAQPPAAVADGNGFVLVTGSGAAAAPAAAVAGTGRQAARRTPRIHAGTTARAVGTPKRTARLHAGNTPRH